jgi:lycopene cyclase domain-containing protein
MSFLYLAALLVSITGMVLLDRRHTLFFWVDSRRATIVLTTGVLFFLAWDLTGISSGVFFRGEGPWMTGILLAPELPIEEVFFLTLLSYMTMNVFSALTKVVKK